MKFGEKVRQLRNERGLSQTVLGQRCNLSLRTIRNYEIDGRYPKQREVYAKLAAALGCDVNYLLSEDEEFLMRAKHTYEYQGTMYAEELIANIFALFARSDLSEDAKDGVMRALQEAYWTAKKQNKKSTHRRNIKK